MFRARGYEGTDYVATGASRNGPYSAFGDKQALDHYRTQVLDAVFAPLTCGPQGIHTLPRFLWDMTCQAVQGHIPEGCFARQAAVDYSAIATATATTTALPATADGHATALPVVQTHHVGSARVTAISDGFLPIGPDLLSGVDTETYAARLSDAHIKGEQHPTRVNAYLIETNDARVLMDAGTGAVMGLGQLGGNLAAMGVDPARTTRARLLDMAATDRLAVAGAHIPFPGIGYLEKTGTGYRWEAAPSSYR